MDVPANVTKILYDMHGRHDDKSDIVCQALAFVNGPLELCIKHHLTGLLGAAQICTHVHTVFNASLRPIQRTVIRELPDIFQVRSGCTTFRYRPAFMFLLEGVSKAFYLGLVAYVSSVDCGSEAECVLSTYLNRYEIGRYRLTHPSPFPLFSAIRSATHPLFLLAMTPTRSTA